MWVEGVMKIVVDRNEVLRYLGHRDQKIDENTCQLIETSVSEVLATLSRNYVYRIFALESADSGVQLARGRLVLSGTAIRLHLKGAVRCAVMALTLGPKIDEKIRLYSRTDVTRALVLDACATAAVESLADHVEAEIRTVAKTEGFFLTERFSPGYGDLPITVQPDIIRILAAREKIGLSVTDSCLLVPQKSVTAVAGIVGHVPEKHLKTCRDCNKYKECSFRREGKHCNE